MDTIPTEVLTTEASDMVEWGDIIPDHISVEVITITTTEFMDCNYR